MAGLNWPDLSVLQQKTGDPETFLMARRIVKEEGILSGGSSGAILCGALRAAQVLKEGQNCVVLLPDGIRNYLSKFASDEWMLQKGYLKELPVERPLFPQHTFDIAQVYNPEQPSAAPFQSLPGPWPTPRRPSGRPLLMDSIAEAIGNTPLVRLNRIPQSEGRTAEVRKPRPPPAHSCSGQAGVPERRRLGQGPDRPAHGAAG